MNALPDLLPDRWLLVVAPRAAEVLLLRLIAHLAWRGSVRVLDGGNRFQPHFLARALQRIATAPHGPGERDLDALLMRVSLARAFTCYQMLALLERQVESDPGERSNPTPMIILDILATFWDESVPLVERRRLLENCLGYLDRLSRQAPLAVSARPPRVLEQGSGLLEQLEAAADQVWRLEPQQPPAPPRLL